MCISWTNKRFDNIKMHGATVKKKGTVNFALGQAVKGEKMYRYSSTLSSTSRIDGVGSQRLVPATLHPRGKTCYALYGRLGGLQSLSGWV